MIIVHVRAFDIESNKLLKKISNAESEAVPQNAPKVVSSTDTTDEAAPNPNCYT
jgi:hypothetical protein